MQFTLQHSVKNLVYLQTALLAVGTVLLFALAGMDGFFGFYLYLLAALFWPFISILGIILLIKKQPGSVLIYLSIAANFIASGIVLVRFVILDFLLGIK